MHVNNMDVCKLLDLHKGRSVALAVILQLSKHALEDPTHSGCKCAFLVCLSAAIEATQIYIPNINLEAPSSD
jgi:hypothetical protein